MSDKSGPEQLPFNARAKGTSNLRLTRRQAIGGAFALAASSLIGGCSTKSGVVSMPGSNPQSSSNPQQPEPSGSITSASLAVTATSEGYIESGFAGLSYEKGVMSDGLFTSTNTALITLFQNLGPSILRLGGHSTDLTVWNANGAGLTSGQVAPSDIDGLVGFLTAAGWKCLYGINLGGSANGTQTPALAAAEVAYIYEKLGSSLLIEIGNEADLYGNAGSFYAGNWSLAQFEALWAEYRSAILAQSPGVNITGPADGRGYSTWTVPFGEWATKNEISLLTQHYYYNNSDNYLTTATPETLLTPDPSLPGVLSTLQAGAAAIGIPYRMTETNSFSGGGVAGVSNAYVTSLWVIDYLFNLALGGATGANFHGNGTGYYAPIWNIGSSVSSVQPIYYGMLLFAMAGEGTIYTTNLSDGSLANVTAYAIATSSSSLSLLVVNENSANLQVTAQVPVTATSATLMELTQLTTGASGPSLSATSGVTIQGSYVELGEAFSPTPYQLTPSGDEVDFYVPALSAVLVKIN